MLALATGAVFSQGRCVTEEPPDIDPAGQRAATDARAQLHSLARAAVARSQSVGAARLLAEAAEADTAEVLAGLSPQASIGVNLGPKWNHASPGGSLGALDGQLSFSLSRLIDDGGRTRHLAESRRLLAEAARRGEGGAEEQVVLATVQGALDLARLRVQQRIYDQYGRKMSCLVDALETVVSADRGRASELVQARKSAQQVEISREQLRSQLRQAELRLRRLVGETPIEPLWPDALVAALPSVPELSRLLADAERAPELRQLGAQAAAQARAAEAADAARKPQLSWVLGAGGSSSIGAGGGARHGASLGVALNLSLPVLAPAVDASVAAARRRAAAATAQLDDALENRRAQVREVHERLLAARVRAERVRGVLASSDQVRNATLQQWQQLGRRSLFDVIAAETEHYSLRLAHVDTLFEAQGLSASLLSLGPGVQPSLEPSAPSR